MQTRAITFGVAAGAFGAAVWAAIVYFFALEIGWLAWGVGLLVGVAVVFGNEGEKSKAAGTAAAIIAALSVIVGKYTAVQAFASETDEMVAETRQLIQDNDEYVISYLADEVVAEYEMEGRELHWPGDTLPMEAVAETDYPADVWATAEARWDSMGPAGQEEFRAQTATTFEETAAMFQDMLVEEGFRSSFSGIDFLFFGLAVVTAYQIAAGKKEEPATEPVDTTPDGQDTPPNP